MHVVIKKYDQADEGQFKNLLQLSHEEEVLVNIVREAKFEFAYSAFDGSKLVGVIFGWVSEFHTNCTYFRILSDPFYVAYDIESKLLAKIKDSKTIKHPLKTSIWETAVNLKSLYEKTGFKEIRRTYMPTLQLDNINSKLEKNNQNKYQLKTLAEILSNDGMMNKLSLIVKRNYEEAHKVDPVIDAEPMYGKS